MRSGLSYTGLARMLGIHAVICDRIAALDTGALAARGEHNGQQIATVAAKAKADAVVASSAAEVTASAQPLLQAIQEMKATQVELMGKLEAVERHQANQCQFCAVILIR